jgi:ribosomal protein L14E/L6E/L27E
MDFVRGLAVHSKAGRDKGRFFVVLALEGDYALIADGDLRKIDKPKRKKLKHLGVTNTLLPETQLTSDKTLYAAIKAKYDSGDRQKEA